jgi:hypothetical protein
MTLLCEKTGVTHLPLSGSNQLAGMDGKARKRASMQRSQSIRARNLYKVSYPHCHAGRVGRFS